MKHPLALALAIVLASAILAGCAEPLTPASLGTEAPGTLPGLAIEVFPSTGNAHTTFHFQVPPLPRADLTYAWDFGDGNTATGPRVSHKYGFTNGIMTVVLLVTDSATGERFQTLRTITLGTGENTAPAAVLDASAEWVEIHTPVHLSAANTTDADGDPLTFLWSYAEARYTGDGKTPRHDDVGDYEITSDEFVIGTGDARLNHTFDAPGYYQVRLLALDPKGGESTASRIIAVTPAVPPTVFERTFTGTLTAGTAGQGASHEVWKNTGSDPAADSELHVYELQYPATTTLILNWTDAGAGVNDLDLVIVDAATGDPLAYAETRGPGNVQELLVTDQDPGVHGILVKAYSGAGIAYELTVRADLVITPHDLIRGSGGHDDGHEH